MSGRREIWGRAAVLAVAVIVALIAFMIHASREPVDGLLRDGQDAFVNGNYKRAAEFAERILRRNPSMTQALHLAGRSSLEAGDPQKALGFFDRIPDEQSIGAVQARCIAGQLLATNLRRHSAAEVQFRRALKLDSTNAFANDQLAWLLGLSAKSWEATPYRLNAVRDQRASREQLFVLALGDLARENPELLNEFRESVPDDPATLLAVAVGSIDRQDYSEARKLLDDVIHLRPGWIEPHVRMGRLLLETGSVNELIMWHDRLPMWCDSHPGIWAIRGLHARRRGLERVAVRCLWESIRRDPNAQQTNYQLGQALIGLERSDDAKPFLERSRQLQQYLYQAHRVHGGKPGDDVDELLAAAKAAATLGLQWEALGWVWLVKVDHPENFEAGKLIEKLLPGSKEPPSVRCHPDFNLALHVNYSDQPLPNWSGTTTAGEDSVAQSSGGDLIRFENQANDVGLRFQYFNGGDPDKQHVVPLYEQTGGGIGAIDYDSDGWPDLYLSQGCAWPPDPQQTDHLDCLYRNTGNGEFVNVTLNADLAEKGFSQGVAAGDFNNDGFTDLYIGNIGPNRLLFNNGDGTFTDVTEQSQTGCRLWTTSCVICDLNGDTLPDIYAVNYLNGDDLLTRKCLNPDGSQRPCRIQSYPAAQDRLYLNMGDGRFEDVTADVGIQAADGRGLGIVAADFDSSGTLNLFIANDVSPNFYFVNRSPRGADRPQFEERGILTGLAANENGEFEAGMGVAAGDADGDGHIDLFVTNFERESNTLYRREENGLFTDITWRARLKDPSVAWLGFGTQFLDANRDGNLDLVLTNGHVDDGRSLNQPYRMPPQFFVNRGPGEFDELLSNQLGDYFKGKYLGRALARVDWNRDGLEDFAVSHLDAPVALLTNTTQTKNGFLSIHLRGTASGRDAIGTTVILTTDERTFVRQLTAGDGYHATNQRQLLFGVPDSTRIRQLEIRWPAGGRQSFEEIPVNRELLIIEGRSSPVLVDPGAARSEAD